MPCSQWDARRPGSEDVGVIGPLLRFRLLRPRGTRFGGLTEPVLSLQWKRPSWCRRGATDYRLACRSPSPRPSPLRAAPFAPPSSFSRSSDSPSPCTRYTCCLPCIIRPSSCSDAPRSVAVVAVDTSSFSEATDRVSRTRTLTSPYCETTVEESGRNVRATIRRCRSCMIDAIAARRFETRAKRKYTRQHFLLSTFPFGLY